MQDKKLFMAGTFLGQSFVAQFIGGDENRYICIPHLSGGNGTDMTFFSDKKEARFFDTLDEALEMGQRIAKRVAARREEDYLTGKTDVNGMWRKEL